MGWFFFLFLVSFLFVQKANACGICGSFTTLSNMWGFLPLFWLLYTVLVFVQKIKYGSKLIPRLVFVVLWFFIFSGLSVDVAWIIFLVACLLETISLTYRVRSNKIQITPTSILLLLFFISFPLFLIYNMFDAKLTEGIIFYPKYSSAQTRGKTAEMEKIFNDLSPKIETYKSEHNSYPLQINSIGVSLSSDLFSLEHGPVYYVTDATGSKALLISRGPNLKFDIETKKINWDDFSFSQSSFQYDPTNGTVSGGDIFILFK